MLYRNRSVRLFKSLCFFDHPRLENSFSWARKKLFRLLLRVAVSRIVSRADVFQSKRPDRGYLRDVLAGFRPVEMGRVARENDHGAGRIGFQLTRVEFITQSDIKDAGNHGIDSILWVLVRHQLLAAGRFDPDCVRAGLRGLTHDDGQPNGRWKRRERFPIDIFRQNGFKTLLPELVGPDFALLSTLYCAGFLKHTNLLRAETVEHHRRLSKHVRQDWLRTPLILNVPAGLARDLAEVVCEPIFNISRLMESARHQILDPFLRSGSTERSDARIPPGAKLYVRWQAGVDEALGLSDCPFVELGDPGRERLYERI